MAVDLGNRDPYAINSHLQVNFEDVLAEPDGTRSCDCVWETSFWCFTNGKNCCYKFMTGICGICIALFWGCEFALITFDQVWCLSPCLRIFSIYMGCCQKFFGTAVQCFLAPVCETCGLCFSRIIIDNQNKR
ncbi:caveolin-1-like [Ylistrum balloti]|uniref:caveolin-1-like n=1 Tax=Ylistrum balloti TaxID=509963 RepID=UPI00290585E0|nr:caveolin-1-like [Ylistrum balloti]